MAKKIVLEYRFTFHQKLMILIIIALFLVAAVSLVVNIFSGSQMVFNSIFGLVYAFLIVLAFLKRGFLIRRDKLFKVNFFVGLPLNHEEIQINNLPKLSVLKFSKSRKLPWFSIARPDAAQDYSSFELNILNEDHTKRKIIMELKKEKNVKPTVDFLTSNSLLSFEKYNPKTRRIIRRRRR